MARHVIRDAGRVVSEILVERGIVDSPRLAEVISGAGSAERTAVLAQPGSLSAATRVAERLRAGGLEVAVEMLPDRDDAKRLDVVEACYLRLNELALTRSDLVVGVGGGALTDVAGFVAATYLRGVDAVLVPTTLLGAVDASIGGKTAVNVRGKNLAGVFRHPRLVVVDPALLEHLPDELVREGSAEALKAGLIGDKRLVELYERDGLAAPLGEVVDRAISVKVGIVSHDFAESGSRAWLNYGHTIGHAVEVVGALSHGAAVGLGMVAAGEASARVLDFAESDRQNDIIRSLGLPVAIGGLDGDAVRRLVALDKKRDRTGVRMTLLRSIGDPVLAPVDAATVDAALLAVGVT